MTKLTTSQSEASLVEASVNLVQVSKQVDLLTKQEEQSIRDIFNMLLRILAVQEAQLQELESESEEV